MIRTIQHMIRAADAAVATAYLRFFPERNALMAFLFHSLFRDEREIALNHVDPMQRTTVAEFRQFISYYLDLGYHFISPAELQTGVAPDKKYVLITFDDGYYSNHLARPILEEFGVPAVFFISTDHVRQNKCFWWDVLYRERTAQGASHARIKRESNVMKLLPTDQIEADLIARFGPNAMRPLSDVDRPFSPAELAEFAQSPRVTLGNHTADHAILTNYSPDQVRQQVRNAQDALEAIAGVRPQAIAYPNGAHSPEIVGACAELGLKVGFTVRPQKVSLPLESGSDRLLQLGRFCLHGEEPVIRQCRTCRSDLLLYGKLRDGYLKLHDPSPAG